MRILQTIDKGDYTSDMPVYEKYTVRGVILRDGKIAVQQSKDGDYKILGGGVDPGESLTDALLREVQEESGLIVMEDTIRPVGEIVEKRRDIFDPSMIYLCHSCFFFCDVKAQMTAMHMTESEKEKGFRLVWATPEEILKGNEPFCETQPWSYRDREFVRMLPELLGEQDA
ncbi:MAG: NUDIX domain-containing protein [Lachnospiraceae bacterium]|nr:NUDIX domain-containing protein [Lachnospiraceae bacterium]